MTNESAVILVIGAVRPHGSPSWGTDGQQVNAEEDTQPGLCDLKINNKEFDTWNTTSILRSLSVRVPAQQGSAQMQALILSSAGWENEEVPPGEVKIILPRPYGAALSRTGMKNGLQDIEASTINLSCVILWVWGLNYQGCNRFQS